MFRSLQILTRTCSQRFLLLLRDSHFSASTDTGAVWQSIRHVKRSRCIEICGKSTSNAELSSSTQTVTRSTQLSVFCLDCNQRLKDVSFPNVLSKSSLSPHHPVQISVSKVTKQVCTFEKCNLIIKSGSAYSNMLAKISYLQHWRKPLLNCTSMTLCNFPHNHLYYRQHSVRAFTLSTHATRILNEVPHSLQSSSFSVQQRTNHLAVACLVDALRNCLSQENENRCRQTLAPNLKLYEVKKVGKGSSQSQGKQGKLASILVSLCTVGGEPMFLFTLRSSTLKGRHKGDVSFAGGKSDPSDRDVVATALREAKEELGITVAAESVWGVLKPLTDVSGMRIAPVLAHLGPLEEMTLKPNPGEVEEVFTLSLSHLCKPQNQGYTHFRIGNKYGYTLPVFCNGKHRVWGLTAVALNHTLKLILPS